jgi:hypothetical protein
VRYGENYKENKVGEKAGSLSAMQAVRPSLASGGVGGSGNGDYCGEYDAMV